MDRDKLAFVTLEFGEGEVARGECDAARERCRSRGRGDGDGDVEREGSTGERRGGLGGEDGSDERGGGAFERVERVCRRFGDLHVSIDSRPIIQRSRITLGVGVRGEWA